MTIAQIVTAEEPAVNDDPLAQCQAAAGGLVRQLTDILADLEPDEEAGVAVGEFRGRRSPGLDTPDALEIVPDN